MNNKWRWQYYCCLPLLLAVLSIYSAKAQTDIDGIMMSKNVFCGGLMYSNTNWENYWEGTFKRDNANLGKVSTHMVAAMGAYGISKKLNVLFGIPYVQTKASAGTLSGMRGIQDLSLWLKWKPVEKKIGEGTLSLFTVGGFSFPTTNYVADFLPLSIGLRSRNLSLRGMVDYQYKKWFATASSTYVVRSNIEIDRTAYYTTHMHNTNKVEMPNASQLNFRAGYRTNRLVAEAVLNKWTTLGGFDITKNNMPFPSNKMDVTTAGVNIKYEADWLKGLTLISGGNYALAGRNVGQSTTVYGGIFYILNFAGNKNIATSTPNTL